MFFWVFVVGIAFFGEARAGEMFAVRPDFLIASLAVAALFLPFRELLFITAFAGGLIAWPMFSGVEAWLLLVLPCMVFFLKKIVFRLRPWFNGFCAAVFCIMAFYAIIAPHFFLSDYAIITVSSVISGIFAFLLAAFVAGNHEFGEIRKES